MADQPNPVEDASHWFDGLFLTPFSLFEVGPEVFQNADWVQIQPEGQEDAIGDDAENEDEHSDGPEDALNSAETQPEGQEDAIDAAETQPKEQEDEIDANAIENEHGNGNEEGSFSEAEQVVSGNPEITSIDSPTEDSQQTPQSLQGSPAEIGQTASPVDASSSGSQMDQQAKKNTEDSQKSPQSVQGCPASEGSKDALDAAETQPVGQFKDIGDTSLPEGPTEPATPLSEVKQEPYNLHHLYEWTTCDMKSDDMCSEVYNLFKVHYPDDGYNFRVNYSSEFLRWALCPPGYYQSWHIGARAKISKKLVAFISGVPARIRVRDEVVKMAQINFLCVHKKLRSKGVARLMIKELTRRVHLQNIWQAAYASLNLRPTPVTTCQYWVRMLNPKKLIDVEFSSLGERMTMGRTVKLYKLPDEPITPGFREMERRDVPAVTELLRNYLSQFGVATDFDVNDVEHWLLPREDVVHSYLVENSETHEVTDFCSFYTVPLTIVGHKKYTRVECAYSYYNVATKTSFPQLMSDALIVSKKKGFDVFYALDVMHNESFLKELKFNPGDEKVHYYLYNYRLKSALKPSELGLVIW